VVKVVLEEQIRQTLPTAGAGIIHSAETVDCMVVEVAVLTTTTAPLAVKVVMVRCVLFGAWADHFPQQALL
jgi:hypothetical protein